MALSRLNQLPAYAQDAIAELILGELELYPTDEPSPTAERILGLHTHLEGFWMSDDFNAELPDEFWGWDKT